MEVGYYDHCVEVGFCSIDDVSRKGSTSLHESTTYTITIKTKKLFKSGSRMKKGTESVTINSKFNLSQALI